jgi:hypothetical protein
VSAAAAGQASKMNRHAAQGGGQQPSFQPASYYHHHQSHHYPLESHPSHQFQFQDNLFAGGQALPALSISNSGAGAGPPMSPVCSSASLSLSPMLCGGEPSVALVTPNPTAAGATTTTTIKATVAFAKKKNKTKKARLVGRRRAARPPAQA